MKKHRLYLWAIFVLESMQPKMRLLLYLNISCYSAISLLISILSLMFFSVFFSFSVEKIDIAYLIMIFGKLTILQKTNCVSHLKHGKTWFAIKFIHCRKNQIELFAKMIINVTCYFLQRENITYLYYINLLRTIVNYFL